MSADVIFSIQWQYGRFGEDWIESHVRPKTREDSRNSKPMTQKPVDGYVTYKWTYSVSSGTTPVKKLSGLSAKVYILPLATYRWCFGCQKKYRGEQLTCPLCNLTDTAETFPDGTPVSFSREIRPDQGTLFEVPPPPRPSEWIMEWRWKKLKPGTLRSLAGADYPVVWPPISNPWRQDGLYGPQSHKEGWKGWLDKKTLTRAAARMRRIYPGKSFRVRPWAWKT